MLFLPTLSVFLEMTLGLFFVESTPYRLSADLTTYTPAQEVGKLYLGKCQWANEYFISRAIVIGSEMDIDPKTVMSEIPVISGKAWKFYYLIARKRFLPVCKSSMNAKVS